MEKTVDPEKYNMVLCPVCNGKGKLAKTTKDFDVCKECGGFGFIKKRKTAMEPKEGEIFKNIVDGTEYIVTKVANNTVILKSQDGKSQILTGVDTLGSESIYQKKEDTK